jgi:hypothetical protein
MLVAMWKDGWLSTSAKELLKAAWFGQIPQIFEARMPQI